MSTDSVYTSAPESLTLGAVLARGSSGITLYKAELLLGQHTLQVQLLWTFALQALFVLQDNASSFTEVAVERLFTNGAPPALELAFLKEIQVLQLAAGTCQRACRMLGCSKKDGDPCIVMSLYPKSAAKLLEDHAGQHDACELYCYPCRVLLYDFHVLYHVAV